METHQRCTRYQFNPAIFSFVVLTLLVISSTVHGEWVEWIADGSIAYQQNDNLNRSGFADNEEDDSSLIVQGSFGRFNQLSDTLRASITADLRADIFDEFSDLNSTSIGTTASLRKKLGLGLTVPWVKGSVSAFYLDVDDDIRSGLNLLGDVQIGKRYSERLDVAAGVRVMSRDGKTAPSASPPISGEVFDQNAWEVYLTSSYLLTQQLLGAIGIAYFDGEIDSACNPGNVATVIANEDLKGIVDDKVFGGCVYRLDVTAITYSIDASYALSRHSSINFEYRIKEAETDYQPYKNNIVNVSFKYSY